MENKDSLVSIVIPTYNVENYIEKCIRSLLGQTYGNIEVIVVSDGSTDSSVRICRELQKTDGRIRIIEKENGGCLLTVMIGLNQIQLRRCFRQFRITRQMPAFQIAIIGTSGM